MKTCERCTRPLDTAAKCALSPVCTTCATDSGEVESVGLLPIMTLREVADWHRLIDRMH